MSEPTAVQIEAAARAIREVVGNRSHYGLRWKDLAESLRESYRVEARAALLAAADVAPAGITIIVEPHNSST